MRLRYGAWSGTQDPFPADVSAEAVLDAVADDLIDGMDPAAALRRLQRRGMEGLAGLDELRRRVAEARRRELERMGLDGPLEAVAERLRGIIERERTAVAFDATEQAEQRQAELDDLPDDVAGQLSRLAEHDWADAGAKADFDALVDELRADLAQAHFGRLAGALAGTSPEDLAQMRDFLAEVNGLVDRRDRGEDVAEGYAELRERHPNLMAALGDPPDLDALLAELAARMSAASRMLASLDPEQRAQLQALAEQLFGDDEGLAFEADRLRRTLARDFPQLGWGEGMQGLQPGAEPAGSVSGAVDMIEHLRELDDLAEALGQRYAGARLDDVDEEAVRRHLGEDSARDLRGLREIERVLEEAGAARRHKGRIELTPRGIRRLGETALARVYAHALDGPAGGHRSPDAGGPGEPTGATRAWRFGDPLRLDVSRTVRNAVVRTSSTAAVAKGAVRLSAEDFELAEAEQRVRVATVLLLDMSFSMPLRGNWSYAKRVALALQALVASKYPEDQLSIIGFSDYARRLQPADLLVAGWERVYGTNMEHAFALARLELARAPGAQHQVIMITDGEPTAHLVDGVAQFAWPPQPETLHRSLAEALRLARTGATLNVFLLDHDPGAARFIERMVRTVGGRLFFPDLDELGDVVVRDFLRRR